MISFPGFLLCAGACTVAVLAGLSLASIWRVIVERMVRSVRLRAGGGDIMPRDVVVNAGDVTLVIASRDSEAFRLSIRRPGTRLTSPPLDPGRTQSWTVRLEPGVYRLAMVLAGETGETGQGRLEVVQASMSDTAV